MITTILTAVLVVVLMVGANALYVAAEFSSISSRRTRIRRLAEQGNPLAKILLPVLTDPHKLDNYIAASQVGITISSIVLGIYGQQQIAPRLEPWLSRLPLGGLSSAGGQVAAAGTAAILVLIFLTTLQVVLGELVPKSIAVQYPEQTALATALPMKWSAEYILRPFIAVLNGSGYFVLRLMGSRFAAEHAHLHSPEEIQILVRESHRGGLLNGDERQLLRRVFRASGKTAAEIAVPRTRMAAASIETPLEEVLKSAADSAYSRLLIFEGDIDNIVGFVHLKDLFGLFQADRSASIRQILRLVPFIPEALPSAQVWDRMNEAQSYLAVVLDEYGGTRGLITQEDLIEELFGDFQDEFDQELALVRRGKEGEFIVRGDIQIDTLNEMLETRISYEASHTLGGLILDHLGRAPIQGDVVNVDGVQFRVEAVSGVTVSEVRVILPGRDGGIEPEKGL